MINNIWQKALLRFSLLLAAALALGWWYQRYLFWLLLLTSALLAWMAVRLYQTHRWLAWRDAGAADVGGIWGDLISRIARLRRSRKKYRKRTHALLGEFKHLARAIPDGGVLLNSDWEIQAFNKIAAGMLGLRTHADQNQRIDNLLRAPEFLAYLRAAQYAETVELESPADPGRRLSLQLITYGQNQYLLVCKDVTRQARLESMRRDFVANASHELRSPLTVIIGYLESLRSNPAIEPELEKPLSSMQQQAVRMEKLIGDLLELSRLESGAVDEDRPVEVAGLLASIEKKLAADSGEKPELVFEYQRGWTISGVGPELMSLFANLVDNAVKYTPVEGIVKISWTVDDDGGHFCVADTGIGISEDDLPRITERFYRVDSGRSRVTGGTGLGLAIVKHVLIRHEGRLEIDSEPGQGSRFSCHFPSRRLHQLKAADVGANR